MSFSVLIPDMKVEQLFQILKLEIFIHLNAQLEILQKNLISKSYLDLFWPIKIKY